jgi:hypothetical protein
MCFSCYYHVFLLEKKKIEKRFSLLDNEFRSLIEKKEKKKQSTQDIYFMCTQRQQQQPHCTTTTTLHTFTINDIYMCVFTLAPMGRFFPFLL